jgi:hypothetical protein
MGLALLHLSGCLIERGCDDLGYCRIPFASEVGRVESALLDRAFIEVCVDDRCETRVVMTFPDGSRSASFQELGAYIRGWQDADSLTVLELQMSAAGMDLDSPPSEARITVTVSSFEGAVYATGTWFMESETLTDPEGERCGRCRSVVLYKVP